MKDFLENQKEVILDRHSLYLSLDEAKVNEQKEGKWSIKQIIGHLIDSASNNHQRFVRSQFTNDLVFAGYDQDRWVEVQDYQNADWMLLLELWKNFNLSLIHFISRISEEELDKERKIHNLYDIAWNTQPEEVSVNLRYFIEDYYGHMQHHLKQIKELYL